MAAFELVFLGRGGCGLAAAVTGADERYDVNGVIRRTSSLLITGKYLIDPARSPGFLPKRCLSWICRG